MTPTRCSAPFTSPFPCCSCRSEEAHRRAAAGSVELVRVNHRAWAHPTPPKASHCSAPHRRRLALVGKSSLREHFLISSSLVLGPPWTKFELHVASLTRSPSPTSCSCFHVALGCRSWNPSESKLYWVCRIGTGLDTARVLHCRRWA
jgi:hypothetical protein